MILAAVEYLFQCLTLMYLALPLSPNDLLVLISHFTTWKWGGLFYAQP